jgi:hypothetical protein
MSMNRAERRRNGIRAVKESDPPARPQAQLFGLVMAGRAEQVAPDGTKLAMIVFRVMTSDGTLLVENTPTGPVPVVVTSQPIPVGRALVMPGGVVPRA